MKQHQKFQLSYEPALLPPAELMRQEGIAVLEDWFRWAEEWSVLLRVYGRLRRDSAVLEIGCGLGRIAFALRYVLSSGRYSGFDICDFKIKFLKENFEPARPNFSFAHANIHNSAYNPKGRIAAREFQFPYPDESFDLIYAASVFTHMLPEGTAQYFREAGRVLRPGGRCLFSFFLLDQYRPGQPRPTGFAGPAFDFEVPYHQYGSEFAAADATNLERMTAYRLRLIDRFALEAGLKIEQSLPGLWSGSAPNWIGAQDMIILSKPSLEAETTRERETHGD